MKELERIQKDIKYHKAELLDTMQQVARRGDLIFADMLKDQALNNSLEALLWCYVKENDYKTVTILTGGDQ